jgi:thymidine kinase
MFRPSSRGWIEVICGPMFSGKSEELIRRVTRSRIARVPVQTFKPSLDIRFSDGEVVSHSLMKMDAIPVSGSDELLRAVDDATLVVGVDEGQFFDLGLVDVAERLADAGKQVIVAGLDTDYMRRPFEPIPTLSGRAEFVTKMLAVCHRCGGPGLFTQRIVRSDDLVVLGAEGSYEARCRACYLPEEAQQPSFELADVSWE